MKKIVFVVGPTASGKSALALRWAIENKAEIINCDSVQAYEKLNIGAAKPNEDDLKKCPHHLYGVVPLSQTQTAGDYRRSFYEKLSSLKAERIFVVGGTGFYFQAIEKGMFPTLPQFPEIRKQIEAELKAGVDLYPELCKKDPVAAQKISPNDFYRIGRALEVIRGERRSLTEIKREFESQQVPFPYPLLKMGVFLDRQKLRLKVEARVEEMMKQGLIQEVRSLLQEGHRNDLALRSIGYKEVLSYLDGQMTEEELKAEIVKNTMGLAKRQMTWFRRDKEIHWLDHSQSEDLLRGLEKVRGFFKAES